MIEKTTSELEEHLEEINHRLSELQSQGRTLSARDTAQHQEMQEEKDSTEKCLDICATVKSHISEVKSSVFQNISTRSGQSQGPITSLDGLILAHTTASDALDQCNGTLEMAASALKRHLQDVDDRLKGQNFASTAPSSTSDKSHEKVEQDLNSTKEGLKQGLAICAEASSKATEERVNVFEDVKIADDGQQVIVSTIGDLIMAKRVTAGNRSQQWMGQMSDASFQQLVSSIGRTTLEESVGSSADLQKETAGPFKGQYGTGFKLSTRPGMEHHSSLGASAGSERY